MDEDTGMSASPRDETSGESRRKRKVLSCHDCRRRKLKCDRRYPSCGRCQKAGKAASCSYDERSVPTVRTDTSTPISPLQNQAAGHAPSEWALNPGSRALQLARLGQRHDMRLAPLEAHQTSGTWQHLGQVSPGTKSIDQRPAVMVDIKDVLASPHEILQTETVIFRGGNFKTQYYGGSNPTSIIAHVGLMIPCQLNITLMYIVPGTSFIYEGCYYAQFFSCTGSARSEVVAGEMESRQESHATSDGSRAASFSP